ncbi:PREDICTED: mpv17-like protein 2 isoform X2 [Nicrophorus vespilloides]|uniref:Mpv17-like protein 2 isoform X2 n=1 Tax=Nicrophorus vespilloides TaxID=110193 RepID=A0ABM1NIN4_NICVS|nr:PREDICTED: mpv17-like protein 2 isoform X2 [Nicrophorus vespilloides]
MLQRLLLQVRSMCTKDKWRQVPKISPSVKGSQYFNKAFGEYLFITNTVTSGGLMAIGDLIQQEIEYRSHSLPERYDWARWTRLTIVGIAMGPLHHYFYKYLDSYLPRRNLFSVAKKILMDQLVMSPICISLFFYGVGMMEGKAFKECTKEINSKFVEVYMIDWSVWPPTQFINFYFLPVQYQVLYINFVTMLYNVFLSYMKHRETAEEHRKKYERESIKSAGTNHL